MQYCPLIRLILFAVLVAACNPTPSGHSAAPETTVEEPMTVLSEVDQLPVFAGCEQAQTENEEFLCFQQSLMQHLAQALQYPPEAEQVGLEGMMEVRFIINRQGQVEDVTLLESRFNRPEQALAIRKSKAAARHAVASIPPVQPAIEQGQPVAVQFTLPIQLLPR